MFAKCFVGLIGLPYFSRRDLNRHLLECRSSYKGFQCISDFIKDAGKSDNILSSIPVVVKVLIYMRAQLDILNLITLTSEDSEHSVRIIVSREYLCNCFSCSLAFI